MRMTNIAVPFVALVALVAADRVFHPHRRPGARCLLRELDSVPLPSEHGIAAAQGVCDQRD